MDTVAAFTNRLRALREMKRLSQTQLADALGVSRGRISYYENGERTPDVEFLALVRDYFHVDYEYLLGESEFPTAADRADFENKIKALSQAKRADIVHFEQKLIECAEAYESHQKIDKTGFYNRMVADLNSVIEAYKAIVYDVARYDSLTTVKRFLDKITHTNYPEVLHRLSQGFSNGEEAVTDGEHNEADE